MEVRPVTYAVNVELPHVAALLLLECRAVVAMRTLRAIEVALPDVRTILGGRVGAPVFSSGDARRIAKVEQWVTTNALDAA